jgi:hypothetical protein
VGAAVDFTNRTDSDGWTSFTLPIPIMSIEKLNLWVVHDGQGLAPAGLGSVNSQCNAPVTQDYAKESFTIQFWSFLSSTAATSNTMLFTMEDFHAGYTTQEAPSGVTEIVLKFKNAYSPEGAIFIIPTTEGGDGGKWVHWSLVYDQGLPGKAQLSVYRFGQKTPSSRRSIEEDLLNGYVKRSPTALTKDPTVGAAAALANASAEAIVGASAGTAMLDMVQFATFSDSTYSDSTSHAVKFSDIRLWKRAFSCQDAALLRYWSQPDGSLRGYDDFGLVGWYRFDPTEPTKNDAILANATETALVIVKGNDNSVSADKPITGSVACSFRNIGFQNKAVLSFDANKAAVDPAFKVNDIVDQGDCPDGYEPIVTITECEQALSVLDLSEEPLKENELPFVNLTSPLKITSSPYGCYLPKKGNYAALFNAEATGEGKGNEVRVCKKPADAAKIPNVPLDGGMAGFTHNQCKVTRGQDTAARFQLFHTEGGAPSEDVKQRCVYSNGILVKQLGTMDHTMDVDFNGRTPGRRMIFSGQKTWDKMPPKLNTESGKAPTTTLGGAVEGLLSCSYARCIFNNDESYDPCTEIGGGWRMLWPYWAWQPSYGCRSIGWGFSVFGQHFLNYGRKPICIKKVTATCPLTAVPDFPQAGSCELVKLFDTLKFLGAQNPSEPKCRYLPFADTLVHQSGTGGCPSGYMPIATEKECESAASYLNHQYGYKFDNTELTPGCHKPPNSDDVHFNLAADGVWEKGSLLVCVSTNGQNPPGATVALKGELEVNLQLPLKTTCEVLYGGRRMSKMNAVASIHPKFLSKIILDIKAHPEGDDKDGYSVQCNAFAARQNLCFTTAVKDTADTDVNWLGYQCVSAAVYDGQPLDFRPWMTNYGIQFSFMDTQSGESGFEIVRHQSFQDIHLGSVVVSIPYGIRGCGRQFASVSFTDEYAAEMPGRKFVYGVRSVLPTAQAGAGGEGGSTYKATEYLVPWISAFTITIGPMRPFVTIQVCRLFHVEAGGDAKKQCTDALSGITASGVYVWYTTSDMFGVANLEINVADSDPIMGWDQVNQRFLVTPLPKLLEENCNSADGSIISPTCLDPITSTDLCTVYEPPNQVITAVHRFPVQAVFEDVSSRIVVGIVKFDPSFVQQKSCMVRGVQVLAKAGTAKLDLLTDDHGMFNFSASVGDIVEIELIFGDHVFTTSEGKAHSKEYFTMGISHVNLEFFDVTHRSIGLELRDDTLNYVINSSQLVWELTAICGDDFVVFNRSGQDINGQQQDTVPALTYSLPALVYAVDITGAPVVTAPALLSGLDGDVFKCTGGAILQITDFFQTLKNNLRIADLRHHSETLRYVYRMGFCASFSLGSFNPSSFPQKLADPCGPEGAELCESEGVQGYCIDTNVVTQEQNKTLVVTAWERNTWPSNGVTAQLLGLSKNNVTGTVRISEAITGDDSPCHPRNGEFVSTCIHDLTPTADAWSTYSESMVIGAPPPTTGFMRKFSITVERVPYDHDCNPESGCDKKGMELIAAALDTVTITRYIPVRGLYKEFGPPKTVTVPTGDRLVFNVLHDPPGGE